MEINTGIATDSQRILYSHIYTSSRLSFKANINSDTRLLKIQHCVLFSMQTAGTVGAQKSNAPAPATTTIQPCGSLQPWKTLLPPLKPAFLVFFCPQYSKNALKLGIL